MTELTKPDREFLLLFSKRYRASATLAAGVVYEARWDLPAARRWWNELLQDEYEIAWVSDPQLVSYEPASHVVVFGPSGHTVDAKGKRHGESGLACDKDRERLRAWSRKPSVYSEPSDLRALDSESGWNLLCGRELSRADLVLGWAAKDAPAGFDALEGPKGIVFGTTIGTALPEVGWARVDLSSARLGAALAHVKALPGAPKKAPKLHLVAGGRIMSRAAAAEPPSDLAGALHEPDAEEIHALLSMLREISADSFDPAIDFRALRKEGQQLALELGDDEIRIDSSGVASPRELEARVVEAVSAYARRRAR